MRKPNHTGKRLAYEWADKQRIKRKKDLLWAWVGYIEGKDLGDVPSTWQQVELKREHAMNKIRERAMKDG